MNIKQLQSTKTVTAKSLDQILSDVEAEWQSIGLPDKSVTREVFKKWMDEVGYKMVLVSLMKLQATEPKAFLSSLAVWNEYITPKSVRKDGTESKGLSISFNMPTAELPQSSEVKGIMSSMKEQSYHITLESKERVPNDMSVISEPISVSSNTSE